jgi:hypothetical protein
MNYEIQLILILLHRKRMDCFETTECFYDRIPTSEVKEAELEGKRLDKVMELFKELYPEDYNKALN